MKGNDIMLQLSPYAPRQQAQPLKANNSQREGMKILAPAEGLIKKAILLATEATNVASSEAKVPRGYMPDQASLDEVLKQIASTIQIIEEHPTLSKFGDLKVTEEGGIIYASAQTDLGRHTLYPPSTSITEKPKGESSPISQLLEKLHLLTKDVLSLPSKRQLTEGEKALISAIGL
jgi:hypothetical protein